MVDSRRSGILVEASMFGPLYSSLPCAPLCSSRVEWLEGHSGLRLVLCGHSV